MVTSCNPYSRAEFHREDSDQMEAQCRRDDGRRGPEEPEPDAPDEYGAHEGQSAGVALSMNGDCPKRRKFSARTYGSTLP